jgi:hypothetical protein
MPDDWEAVCDDEDGAPGGVVAYCHPANGPLIAAAPEMAGFLAKIRDVKACSNSDPDVMGDALDEIHALALKGCELGGASGPLLGDPR